MVYTEIKQFLDVRDLKMVGPCGRRGQWYLSMKVYDCTLYGRRSRLCERWPDFDGQTYTGDSVMSPLVVVYQVLRGFTVNPLLWVNHPGLDVRGMIFVGVQWRHVGSEGGDGNGDVKKCLNYCGSPCICLTLWTWAEDVCTWSTHVDGNGVQI